MLARVGLLLFAGNALVVAQVMASGPFTAEVLADISSSGADSNPADFAVLNDTLYFTANDGPTGTEIWMFDGANVSMLADLTPGPDPDFGQGAWPQSLTVAGSHLFFTLDDGVVGEELWVTDGTPEGTRLVKDINPNGDSSPGSSPGSPIAFNGELFFTANDENDDSELWKSDGTELGTVRVKDINPTGISQPRSYTVYNGELFFSASDGVNGIELWKTDGTESGTVMVINLNGTSSSSPQFLVEFDGLLHFVAITGSNRSIYATDGTQAGTTQVYAGTSPTLLTPVPELGALFFTETQGGQRELFIYDGSRARRLVDLAEGNAFGSTPSALTNVNGTLYFGVRGGNVYQSDGTPVGTTRVDGFAPRNGNLGHAAPFALGDTLLAYGSLDGTTGDELIGITNGMPALIKDIRPGTVSSFGNPDFTEFGGELFFAARGPGGIELWKTDGTEEGTVEVADINTGTEDSAFGGPFREPSLIPMNGDLFFWLHEMGPAFEGPTLGLWKVDAAGNAAQMSSLGNENGSQNIRNLTASIDHIYFSGNDSVTGDELWRSDGTVMGTELVINLLDDSVQRYGSEPEWLTPLTTQLVFRQGNSVPDNPGYRTDGTELGTVEISPDFSFAEPIVLNGTIYYSGGGELMQADGTLGGASMVADLNGASSSLPRLLTRFGNRFVFVANGGEGRELWISDGTAAGTRLTKDINPSGDGVPIFGDTAFIPRGDDLFFVADDGEGDPGLWKTDGTEAGTALVMRFPVSSPGDIALYGATRTHVFFTVYANNEREWWASDGTEGGTQKLLSADGFSTGVEGTGADGQFFFVAREGTEETTQFGEELYVSDGTPGGTVLAADIRTGVLGSEPRNLRVWNGDLYFIAKSFESGREIHVIRDVASIDAGEVLDNWANRLAAFRSAFSVSSDDLGGEGLPDSAALSLAEVAVNIDHYTPLDEATREAFNSNLSELNSVSAGTALEGLEDIAAALMVTGSERLAGVRSVIEGAGIDLSALNLRTAVEPMKLGNEPYSALGDIDGDGATNLDEYNAVMNAGSDLFGFLETVLDAGTSEADTTPPVITLNGQNPLTVDIFDAFVDPGATAIDDVDGEVMVTVEGTVNANAIGDYVLTYSATDSSGNRAEVTRTVQVRDFMIPIISLNGSAEITINVGDPFTDPGATATDNVDGEVEVVVGGDAVDVNTPGTYIIEYTATDSSGNQDRVTRTVIVEGEIADTTPPVITLIGDAQINLDQGDSFTDPGATAEDNVDGTVSVSVGGDTVDVNTPGTYVIVYTATDSAGNRTQATRTVVVSATTQTAPLTFCEVAAMKETLLAAFRADFGIDTDDLSGVLDPRPYTDEAAFALAEESACRGSGSQLEGLTFDAYTTNQENLATFIAANSILMPDLEQHADIVAGLAVLSSARRSGLIEALQDAGIDTTGLDLVFAACSGGGCFPTQVKDATDEPYSAEADLDGDGITNAEEWNNIVNAGGDAEDFGRAAIDPQNDGTVIAVSLCDDVLPTYEDALSAFYTAFDISDDGLVDLGGDGLPDLYAIALFEYGACTSGDNPLMTATSTAFELNLAMLESLPVAKQLTANSEIVAVLASTSNARAAALLGLLDQMGYNTEALDFAAVECDEEACLPQPAIKAGEYIVFAEGAKQGLDQPYAARGDFDMDGVDNKSEFENVRAAGGGVAAFVAAATDPGSDGTETPTEVGCAAGSATSSRSSLLILLLTGLVLWSFGFRRTKRIKGNSCRR